jgi:putative spermidine/putrescine transport system substrate-binding protein
LELARSVGPLRRLVRGPYRTVAAMSALVAVTLTAVAAGCNGGTGGEQPPPGIVQAAARTLGPGEGSLSLVTWPGYVEDGSSDPQVDWVSPFEERTGCKVELKVISSPRDMYELMIDPQRRYDGVIAPPEVSGRLIANGQATPVNTNLLDGYKRLQSRLRALFKHRDKVYGVPYTWSSNMLMYDPKAVGPAPSGWASVFDPAEAKRHGGRLIMRDSPLTLAEAALYLKAKRKKLDIDDPYALTREQLDAAAEVVRAQREYVESYWRQPAEPVSAFAEGRAVLGGVSTYQLDVLTRAGRSVAGVLPREGVTARADAWLIGARAQHPNCMYQWLTWSISPEVQHQVAEWAGLAPANPEACAGDRLKPAFCSAYRVTDAGYLKKAIFAQVSTKECDGVRCASYLAWSSAWQRARG